MWTVIREDALFTFEVRVTGIWNLAKAGISICSFPSFVAGVEFHVNRGIEAKRLIII